MTISKRNKAFLQALLVFLLTVGGMMLFRPAPEPMTRAERIAAARKQNTPPMPVSETDRFRRTLSFRPAADAVNGWTAGKDGTFRDEKTGLVWGPMLEKPVANVLNAKYLDEARGACATLAPAGTWSLPTGDEMDAAEANGLKAADKNAAQPWIAYNMMGRHPAPTGRPWDGSSTHPLPFRVRCVAKAD